MAFGKRVGGAPEYQNPDVTEQAVARSFEKFSSACFVENWRDVVKARVAGGLGQPRQSTVADTVAKMTPSNVKKAASESMTLGELVMTDYHAMVKRQPKDKLDSAVAFEHTPTQTIMYQPSKVANAYSSSVLSEFHDLLDEILRPGVLVNPRKDKAFSEAVWNAANRRAAAGGVPVDLIEVDISQCDKSQTQRNLMRYFYFLKELGLGEEIAGLWEVVIGRKTAVSQVTSVRIDFFAQVVSGLFATISMNSIITAESYIECTGVTRESLISLVVSGDDALGKIVAGTVSELSVMAEKFAGEYNFEAKVFMPKVGYWCGRYVVPIDGYEFFVKDPERLFSALARPQLTSYNAEEAFESFVDDTVAYQWEEVVCAVAKAVKERQGRRVAPLRMCRGVSTLRLSSELYVSRFVGTREIRF
jgi:hypothetical protein